MEYTSGSSSWRRAVGRAVGILRPRRRAGRSLGWSVGVPAIMVAAGVLFTTSANIASGTDLREDRRPQMAQVITEQQARIAEEQATASRLRTEVDDLTGNLAGSDTPIAQARAQAEARRRAAGLTALKGPGLTVRLNDAPASAGNSRPDGATNDDLVVHQQDVQSVVNALWAGGAEAMTIMGVRIISTSAVRCVGNTILLEGQVYSPPFVIKAIGDPSRLHAALDAEPGVRAFQDAVRDYGLGYQVVSESEIVAPAYTGSTDLTHAEVAR
ncbi:DUF881 domain-containing protein [Hamadaea flava]|uniref:DUF881 domain-containing protein n=1 Tax=Hamadaea flava TaxID=1742688 RepID=A0ABV8LER8_9ACTN|nr:DUF881 domain-containing protein [Hamadaea flava]